MPLWSNAGSYVDSVDSELAVAMGTPLSSQMGTDEDTDGEDPYLGGGEYGYASVDAQHGSPRAAQSQQVPRPRALTADSDTSDWASASDAWSEQQRET